MEQRTKMVRQVSATKRREYRPLWVALWAAIGTLFLGALTAYLLGEGGPLGAWARYRPLLLALEVGLGAVVTVEALARHFQRVAQRREAEQLGVSLRLLVRAAGYVLLAVALLSYLSQNAALAVGVGSVTGLVVGLAAQAVIGNAVAGLILTLSRTFAIRDEISVAGVTGRIVEIRSLHTVLETPEETVFLPNSLLLNQVIRRTKEKEANSGG